MDYCDFPIGQYRASVTTHYLDNLKNDRNIRSNYFYFESTQPVEEILVSSAGLDIQHRYYKDNDRNVVWIAYVGEEDGVVRIKYSDDSYPYKWQTYHFPYLVADQCGLCFNSQVKNDNDSNIYEFITDELPFLYYIRNGALYVYNLQTKETVMIAAENVISADMVRGSIALDGSYDLGMIIFFLAGEQIFYRQYINNVWYDAEVINTNSINSLFDNLRAFRTWDFKVGLLLKTIDNELYQLTTYTQGLSNLCLEHIELNVIANANLQGIRYINTSTGTEYIDLDVSTNINIIYGLSSIPVSVNNIEDSSHNWGTTIQVVFDYPNTENNLQTSSFTLVDSNNNNFICNNVSLSQDGLTLTLVFDDFNATYRATNTTLTYTKPSSGGLISVAGQQTDPFTLTFVPQNLVDPGPPPAVDIITNNTNGMVIYIQFTDNFLNNDLSDVASHFGISMQEYNYVPNGTLVTTTRTVNSVAFYNSTDTLALTINTPNFSSVIGDITITYDGLGGLRGIGGPTTTFTESFTPTGLSYKGNHNNNEYLTLNVSASTTLIQMVYHETTTGTEYIVMNVTANTVLTDIHDL